MHCGQHIFRSSKANSLTVAWRARRGGRLDARQDVLQKYHDELEGDTWLICDGPIDQSGRQTVVFGARGMTHLRITLFGPNRELHSGHYGNWAPNPAMMLAQLLAGMKDETGRVLIPHFYDGVVPLTALGEASYCRCAQERRRFAPQ